MAETSKDLWRGMEKGWVKPVVSQEFPLEEAGKAQEEVIAHTGGSKGRIILSTV